jgi:carbon monoxide dehydrogenase subunit G
MVVMSEDVRVSLKFAKLEEEVRHDRYAKKDIEVGELRGLLLGGIRGTVGMRSFLEVEVEVSLEEDGEASLVEVGFGVEAMGFFDSLGVCVWEEVFAEDEMEGFPDSDWAFADDEGFLAEEKSEILVVEV